MNARRVVMLAPWPTMIPERIGTIGNTQGVKPRSSPKPKKVPSTSSRLPLRTSLAKRSCSDTNAPPVAPRGKLTWMLFVIGG